VRKILVTWGLTLSRWRDRRRPCPPDRPVYGNTPDPEKSLHWFAFNSSKRGITLNLEADEGQELFKKLSSRADVVMESHSRVI